MSKRSREHGDPQGPDTTSEVLIVESGVKVTLSSVCAIVSGRWVSVFDGKVWTWASDVDTNHDVPAEVATLANDRIATENSARDRFTCHPHVAAPVDGDR